jgi:hypothetical protein
MTFLAFFVRFFAIFGAIELAMLVVMEITGRIRRRRRRAKALEVLAWTLTEQGELLLDEERAQRRPHGL